MGVAISDVSIGFCSIKCTVSEQMLNGFSVAHGGIIFSLADSALAFAAATTGRPALALDHSISFTRKVLAGDTLTATAKQVNLTRKTGLFTVEISNQASQVVAVLKGTVYLKTVES